MSSLLSTVIGKVLLGVIIGLITAALGLIGWVYLLKADIRVERSEKQNLEQALALQSTLIETNRAEYEKNLAAAITTKKVIKTEYKTRVQIIEKWRESNATCENAISYLNTYNF